MMWARLLGVEEKKKVKKDFKKTIKKQTNLNKTINELIFLMALSTTKAKRMFYMEGPGLSLYSILSHHYISQPMSGSFPFMSMGTK